MTIKLANWWHENCGKLRINQLKLYTKNNSPYELGELSKMLFQSFKSLNEQVFKNRLNSLILKIFTFSVKEFIIHCTSGGFN